MTFEIPINIASPQLSKLLLKLQGEEIVIGSITSFAKLLSSFLKIFAVSLDAFFSQPLSTRRKNMIEIIKIFFIALEI